VALVIVVVIPAGVTKSSADSISTLPAEDGREAVAISPSGLPVLKKKMSADAAGGDAASAAPKADASKHDRIVI
jgi:hypothetical protein